MHHRPDVLRLDDALVGVKHDHRGEVTLTATPMASLSRYKRLDTTCWEITSNGANAVADHRSVFVGVHVCGIHLQRKFLEEFGRLSVEDFAGRLDPFEVAFRIDAWPGAKADVHGQAALRKQFFAIANAEVPPEQRCMTCLAAAGFGKGPHF